MRQTSGKRPAGTSLHVVDARRLDLPRNQQLYGSALRGSANTRPKVAVNAGFAPPPTATHQSSRGNSRSRSESLSSSRQKTVACLATVQIRPGVCSFDSEGALSSTCNVSEGSISDGQVIRLRTARGCRSGRFRNLPDSGHSISTCSSRSSGYICYGICVSRRPSELAPCLGSAHALIDCITPRPLAELHYGFLDRPYQRGRFHASATCHRSGQCAHGNCIDSGSVL